MKNILRQIMRDIRAKVTCKDRYKIITIFLLTPQDDEGSTFVLDVIAGVKENEKYNNYTKIFYNKSMPFSVTTFKEIMLEAYDMYRVEAIIPENWRSVNKFWWETIENEVELINYAIAHKEWQNGKIGFRIIQKF